MSIAQRRLHAPRRRGAASTPQARKPAERQEKIGLNVWSCRKSAPEVLRRLLPQHDIVAANEDGENRASSALLGPAAVWTRHTACRCGRMFQLLAVGTDFLHAMLMVAWTAGLPLLLWHRWPRATLVYAAYAIAFVAISQLSQWLLGECFLTDLAVHFWQRVPTSAPVSREWFTVRIARDVFHLAPSHRSIVRVSEPLIVATAVGALWSFHRLRVRDARPTPERRIDRDLTASEHRGQ